MELLKNVHEKLKERKVKVYDATCVFVNKIRQEIEIANEKGYSILFMGDKNHPEVKGVISFADNIQIFESLEEAMEVKIDSDKTYLLSTQTTLNKKKFEEVKKIFQRKLSKCNNFLIKYVVQQQLDKKLLKT